MSVAARLAVTFLTVFGAEQVLPAVAPGVSASAMPVDYTVFVPRAKDDPSRKDPTQVGDLVNEHFTVVDNPKTGSLLAFWTQETRESAPDMHVAFARSTDGGANWTKPREEGAALFNGNDLSGWTGATHMYVADASEPGVLRCEQARIDEWKTCNLFTEREYGDFVLSFECNMAKGANNGVGIRMPAKIKGEPAWESFCEVQLIDDDSSPRLKPHQHTGSVYGVISATPGPDGRYAKPCGEWSRYEIRVIGTTIEVRIDGRLATKGDLAQWRGDGDTVDGKPHPGLHRTRGRIGFLGHYTDRPAKDMIVRWRNIRIKEL